MEKVKLTVSGLRADLEGGITRKEMAVKYGLSPAQIKLALKQAGLEGVKTKKVAFELVEEEGVSTAKFPGGAEIALGQAISGISSDANLNNQIPNFEEILNVLEQQDLFNTTINEL